MVSHLRFADDFLLLRIRDSPGAKALSSLDLALIGNGTISALIDENASIVWCCFPRFDADPAFCSLLAGPDAETRPGSFRIELNGVVRREQEYIADTPILTSRLYDAAGASIEITDFCPRFGHNDGLQCPSMLVRLIRPIAGRPSITVSLSPVASYGCDARKPLVTENGIVYAGWPPLLLHTNVSPSAIIDQTTFVVDKPLIFIIGRESISWEDGSQAGQNLISVSEWLLGSTTAYWRKWSRDLSAPKEWHDAAVRAAITLELHVYQETGAIIAATTTSIPEAPNSGRNWDYRYCWPRDAYFTADALSRVGEGRALERFLEFLLGVAEKADGRLTPIYNLDGGSIPVERVADCLPGYRGMGPVRVGNKASEQNQNDLYGEAVLTAEAMFLRAGVSVAADESLFARLEPFGEQAARLYDQADAGLWELRGSGRIHTFSSVMCWVACNRLASFAQKLNLAERAKYWGETALRMRDEIWRRSWNEKLNCFTATMDGDSLDASLLLMPRLGFIDAQDPRFAGTVSAIERDLKHDDFIYRYVERDDFGFPENAFLVCTFWYIDALARMGGKRRDQARSLFEKVLSARNRHGLLSEDLDPRTLELWGNFPQTYCMAGIIECAIALSDEN